MLFVNVIASLMSCWRVIYRRMEILRCI